MEDSEIALRVLLLAEACNPDWTSVPLLGWHWSEALSGVAEIHLVAHVRNRTAISGRSPSFPVDFVDNEWLAAPLHRVAKLLRGGQGVGWTTSMAISYPAYLEFERRVWRLHGERVRKGAFDVVHRVTPVSPTLPSLVASRCHAARVPFVVGPLNGGLPWPGQFESVRREEREWLSPVRNLYRRLPYHRSTFAAGTFPVAGSLHTRSEILRSADTCAYLPENGVDPAVFHPGDRPGRAGGPLRVTWIGRMVPYKMPAVVLRALAACDSPLSLQMVGEGPLRSQLESLVRELGLENRVTFPGWLDHSQLGDLLRESDVFCFPSIREFGGGVVAEAMACGAVPVVADYGGPRELVDESCGIRLPLGSERELEQRVKVALEELAADPDRLANLSRSASSRARRYLLWPAKADHMAHLYGEVIDVGRSGRRWEPRPFPPIGPSDEPGSRA